MQKVKEMIKTLLDKKADPNKRIKLALIFISLIVFILTIILLLILLNRKDPIPEDTNKIEIEQPIEEEKEKEEKTMIVDIPSLKGKDAFEILDLLIEEYGEPNPKGLVEVLKEFRDINDPSFETVNWIDIKHGYNFTFNFWTDGSLAREDSYYIIGYKNKNHTLDEIFELTNLEEESQEFIYKITDLGGAVFNIGITPKEAAGQEEPNGGNSEGELTRDEILEILEQNAATKWKDDTARAKLEFDNQAKAYNWLEEQTDYPNLMEDAKEEWKHDYIMVKWEYEKEVKAYEETLKHEE